MLREIGLHDSTNPVVKHLVSQTPETQSYDTWPFLSLYHLSPYRDFGSCDVMQLIPSTPETQITETLMFSQG
jgi:hypothetical protein